MNFVISHNNKKFNVPTVNTNNRQNFMVLKQIMLKHHYFEFMDNFETIYNNYDDYHKRACYWIFVICNEYKRVKDQNKSLNLTKIIQHLIMEGSKKHRLNNSVFHLNYIGFILYWKYYKINCNNCNTLSKFNAVLTDLKLPSNLTKGFPTLLKTFDIAFADIMKEVIEAHKSYYERKNEMELIDLDKKFRVEFKKQFDKYKSYLITMRTTCCEIDWNIYETLFIDYYENSNYAIANRVLSKLLKNDYGEASDKSYNKLSKKYPLINVDYDTRKITKMVFEDFSYYIEIGLKVEHNIKGICNAVIKDFNKHCLNFYTKPKYKFDSIEHRELIDSLLQ